MGLFSSKSSSTTQQFDQRQGADNGSLVAREGTINYSSDTPEAFDVANKAISNTNDSLKVIADFASNSLKTSIGAIDQSAKRVQEQSANSLKFADSFTRSDSTNVVSQFISYLPWIVGGGGLAYFIYKGGLK